MKLVVMPIIILKGSTPPDKKVEEDSAREFQTRIKEILDKEKRKDGK